MREYQRADSELTLAGGLREYYASRADLAGGRGASQAAREFFRCHDAAHVVFACDTTLAQEGIVKLWSCFATDAGLGSLLADYALPESREIYSKLTLGEEIGAAWAGAAAFPRVLWRSLRMPKRWPWRRFDAYLDVSLRETRREFGIRPL
jgi:hypothetical protein